MASAGLDQEGPGARPRGGGSREAEHSSAIARLAMPAPSGARDGHICWFEQGTWAQDDKGLAAVVERRRIILRIQRRQLAVEIGAPSR